MSYYIDENEKLWHHEYGSIKTEKELITAIFHSEDEMDQISEDFYKKHCTFDEDGHCNFDHDIDKDEVWMDYRDSFCPDQWEFKKQCDVLNIEKPNDLSTITLNGKPLINFNEKDFKYIDVYFDISYSYYSVNVENSDIEHIDLYKLENGEGELHFVSFVDYDRTGETLTTNELFEYLNENCPERDELNYLNHSLNLQSNDVKLLMISHKDSDIRLDSNFFLIDKEDFEEYINDSRRLEDVSVYDEKLNEIRNNSDVADLHNTIVLDYQKTQENKLTVDKMQSIVDKHSTSDDKPKSKRKIRNKM
ncbi:Uncharacterised protein [Vibrio cholerae]|nr:Uncharacterised protein [Vibrio cholerae]